MSADPNDLTVLTPGHFLVGGPMVQPIAPSYTDFNENRLNSWQRIHQLQQDFWDRWKEECIVEMQARSKWLTKKPNLMLNDMVVLKNAATLPAMWLLGRVVATYPGPDGLVRSVDVRTQYHTFKRPIGQLVLLPTESRLQEGDENMRVTRSMTKSNVINS